MDIDNLQISIVSDTTKANSAILGLIHSLDKLSGSLKRLDTSGLQTMASNIRSVATAVGALNRNIEKVSFTKADASAKQMDKTIDSAVKNVIQNYGVRGREAVNEVSKAFREAGKAAMSGDWDSVVKGLIQNAEKAIREYTVLTDGADQYQQVLERIRQTQAGSIRTPQNVASEFKDDYLRMMKTAGGNIFSKNGQMSFDEFYSKDLAPSFPNLFPADLHSEADQFQRLYEVMELARHGSEQFTKSQEGQTIVQQNARSAAVEFLNTMEAEWRAMEKAGGATQQTIPSMEMLGEQLRGMSGIELTKEAESVAKMANAIGQLGYAKVDKAATNLPKVTAALKQMMQELSTAPAVSENVIRMTEAIGQLQTRVSTMPTQTKKASTGWNTFSQIFLSGSNKMRISSFSLAAAWGKMYASFFMVFRAFNMLKKAINLSAEMTEQQHIVDVAFGEMSDRVAEFSKDSIKNLGMSQLTVAKTAGRFQAMGNALGITGDKVEKATANFSNLTGEYAKQGKSMADMSLGLTRLTADMSAFYNEDYSDMAEAMQTIFTGQARPLRRFGIDISQTTLKEWAMKQGLDANIESMTQAEKAMLRYQYVMQHSQQAHGDFARTSGTWANQVRILKENFQALGIVVGQGLIQAFKPALVWINRALIAVTEFAEKVVNALGKIFGWQIDISAGSVDYGDEISDGMDDIGDSAGNAGKAVKDLKGQLQGFDKLNVLTTPNDGSGGGGSGGGSGAAGGGGGGDVGFSVKDTVGLFESDIDSLRELGEYMSQALGDAVANIDWESIYEKAKNFGKGLAEFLNGLFATREDGGNVFSDVTKTIAHALNAVVYAACEFAVTFDWVEFGKNLATSINDFFLEFDWQKAGFTVHSFVQGLKNALISFLTTLTWKDIFSGVGTFLGELTPEDYALIFAAWTTFKVASWVTSGGFVTTLMGGIGQAIADAGGWSAIMSGALTGSTGATTVGGSIAAGVGGMLTIALPVALSFAIVKLAFEWTYEKHKDEEGVEEVYQAALGDLGYVTKNKDGSYTVDQNMVINFKTMFSWIPGVYQTFRDWVVKNVLPEGADYSNGEYTLWEELKISFDIAWGFITKPLQKFSEWIADKILPDNAQYADGEYTLSQQLKISFEVAVEWIKKGFKSLWELLFGGGSEGENDPLHGGSGGSYSVDVSANVEAKKTGALEKAGNILNWLTGRDDGTTVTTNKARVEKSKGWAGRSFLNWLTGGKGNSNGDTVTTNTTRLAKSKGWAGKTYAQAITGSKSGNTSGTFTTYVKPNYGGYSSFAQLVYNGKNGLDVHAKMIIDKLEAGKGVHIDGTSGRAYINLATGGMLVGQHWKPIPQYAGGTLSAAQGQIFVAREAGPELVGSIGGHTAVMNNNQIVASVAYGVQSAVSNAMQEQNAILRSQNTILTQILVKEWGITQSDVFNAVRSENTRYMNRTGRSAFSY